ncbi:MAG: spore coat protein U domain-containing protein [Burkholderiales bacterium]|jgi:spore coat protein U-like protein|nr:spore coat protein U domain-containing protein [Burkholderiales bacterium]
MRNIALICILILTPLTSSAVVCTLLLSGMAFGIYNSILPSSTDTTSTITVSCIPGGSSLTTNYTLTIAGTGINNDTTRSIVYLGNRLYYQVYKDPSFSTVWGNTAGTGLSSSVTSSGALVAGVKVHNVYSRIQSLQNVSAGLLYSGSLNVTLSY